MGKCIKHNHHCIYIFGWLEHEWCQACLTDYGAFRRFCCETGTAELVARGRYEAEVEVMFGRPPVPVPPWEQPAPAAPEPQFVSQLLMPWWSEPASEEQIREALGRVADGVAWSLEQLAPSAN